MRQRLARWCIAVCVMPFLVPEAHGSGAWTQAIDDYYVKLSSTWSTASVEYGLDGQTTLLFPDSSVVRNGTFGTTEVGLYVEYGVNDWLTAVGSTHYKVIVREAQLTSTSRDTALSASGLSDSWIGGRVQLTRGDIASTATVSVKIPTGSPNQQIPLGTGVVDYEIAATVGRSIPMGDARWGWAQGSVGYRFRNQAANDVTYTADGGVDVGSGVTIATRMDGLISGADFEEAYRETDQTAARNRLIGSSTYHRWSAQVIYASSPGIHLNAGYGFVYSGRNVVAVHGLSVGIAWTRR